MTLDARVLDNRAMRTMNPLPRVLLAWLMLAALLLGALNGAKTASPANFFLAANSLAAHAPNLLWRQGNWGFDNEGASDAPVAAKGGMGFADEAKLIGHFEKHGAEFGAKSASEYLQAGQDIMQYGQKVEYLYKGETRTGFIQFMGNKANGQSKFGFVGTNADGAITTIHTESGNSLWKMLNNGNIDKTIRPIP